MAGFTTLAAIRNTSFYLAGELEGKLQADVITMIGPIVTGAEHKIRDAIEQLPTKRPKLAFVLGTPGGLVEVVERIVNTIRTHYKEVIFIVPDTALSAGTVLVMSGDSIMMSYFSCLGPIDPQIQRNGTLVPALSYLTQYNRLIQKSQAGALTTAEYAMLGKFDLAELHKFEEAKELSITLLVKWLANYKFKDWTETETRKAPVDQPMREARAKSIADELMDHERWHSHGRGIPMAVLVNDLGLRIDDYRLDADLADKVDRYYSFLADYMRRENLPHFVHTRQFI